MPIQTPRVRVTLEENPNLRTTVRTREHLGAEASIADNVQARLLGIPGAPGTDGIDGQDGATGPQGPPGPSGAGAEQVNTTVAASGTSILDSIDTAVIDTIKWLVTTIDAVGSRKQAVEIVAIHINAIAPRHVVYGRIGDKFNTDFTVDITGVNLELQVTNNETVGLDFKVLKFTTVT